MKRWHKLAALAAGVATLAGAGASARVADAAPSAQAPIQVGVVYSRTGLLAAYGAQFVQGLRYGIAYATKGTGAVNGRKIELTLVDDGTDPVKAVAGAKDLIGKGYKIITGTASSGIALQLAPLADQNKILYISGPAATDAVTGVNKNTFRSGRQSIQDVLTAGSFLGGGGGKTVTVLAQDSAFGQGNYLAVKALMEDLGGQKVNRHSRPALGTGLHAVRPAGQAAEDRPAVRRMGGHDRAVPCGARSISRTCSSRSTRS